MIECIECKKRSFEDYKYRFIQATEQIIEVVPIADGGMVKATPRAIVTCSWACLRRYLMHTDLH